MTRLVLFSSALLLISCGDDDDDTFSPDDGCDCWTEKPEDVPAIFGDWSTDIGWRADLDENCAGFSEDDIGFLSEYISIDGRIPDSIRVKLAPGKSYEREFMGVMASTGGLVASGWTEHNGFDINLTFSGLVYDDEVAGNRYWEGSVFMGLDSDGNGAVDCTAFTHFRARKVGN
jgi:hypothetical protein